MLSDDGITPKALSEAARDPQHLQAMLESMDQGGTVYDSDQSLVRYNQRSADLFSLALVFTLTVFGAQVRAEKTIYKEGSFSLNFGIEAGTYYVHSEGTNFGFGRVDLKSGAVGSASVDSIEAYIKPSLTVTFGTEKAGTIYGGIAFVGTATRGDGDPGGFTSGSEEDLDNEQLFIGWRSAKTLESLGEDAIDLSYGRQEFRIGDGFLIDDGNTDQLDKATYWLAPRSSFNRAGLLRINTKPVRGDAFYLKSDSDQDNTELVGANIEFVHEKLGTVGGSFIYVTNSDNIDYVRDGMNVFSLRAQGHPIPSIKGLFLSAEYVREKGGTNAAEIDAHAWYGEAAYTLGKMPWSPKIAYRYSRFSGDKLGTSNSEDFDPLFYGGDRSWGTWTQGEVVGEYLLFNSNQRTHMVHLSATPSDSVGVGVIYYNFQLDQMHYFGTPVTDRDFADEVNIYIDWYPKDYLSLGALYGVAFPGQGGEDALGGGDSFHVLQVYATLTF